MYQELSLYIDGTFRERGSEGRNQPVYNPATEEVLGYLPHAGQADLDAALQAAQRAFDTWRKTPPLERAAVLRRAAQLARERVETIARNITLDQEIGRASCRERVEASA